MNTYFKVIEDLKTIALAEPFVNTVTQGDITEIDLTSITKTAIIKTGNGT